MPRKINQGALDMLFSSKTKKSSMGMLASAMEFGKKMMQNDTDAEASDQAQEEVHEFSTPSLWPYKENQYLHLKQSKPENFLKQVAISIELSKLYELKQTCFLDASFESLAILLRVKDKVLFRGYNSKKYILQIWNKECQKVYQKELYRRPLMWSSNKYIVFKPHPLEAEGNVHGDTTEEDEKEEHVYSGDEKEPETAKEHEDQAKAEQAKEKAAEEFSGSNDMFYIVQVGDSKHETYSVRVQNWIQEENGHSGIVAAIFGKNLFSIATATKVYFGAFDFDKEHLELEGEKGLIQIAESAKKQYDPKEGGQADLRIQVFNAMINTTADKDDAIGEVQMELALRKPDHQLAFVDLVVKPSFEGEWVFRFDSITHHVTREDKYQHKIRKTRSVNQGRNRFTFAFCAEQLFAKDDQEYDENQFDEDLDEDSEQEEKQSGFLDVYLNGNRINTLEGVVNFGFDDQNLFISRYEKVMLGPQEFKERQDEYEELQGYGYSDEEITLYFKLQKPVEGKPCDFEVCYSINLEQGKNISWAAATKNDDDNAEEISYAHLNSALSYGNPFSSINLIGDSIYVSHSHIISRYSILTESWTSHMEFPDEITKVVRVKNKKKITTKKQKTAKEIEEEKKEEEKKKEDPGQQDQLQDLYVVLHNNAVYKSIVKQFKKKDLSAMKDGKEVSFRKVGESKCVFKAEGKEFVKTTFDPLEARAAIFYWPESKAIKAIIEGETKTVKDIETEKLKNIVLISPMVKEPYVLVEYEENLCRVYRIKLGGKDKDILKAKLLTSAKTQSRTHKFESIHSACLSEEYGQIVIVDSKFFYNFKILAKPEVVKELKEGQKAVIEKPLMEKKDLEGSIIRTANHEVKAIFTKDQKHFYAIRRGNMDVEEGLAMYEAKQIFEPVEGEVKSSFLAQCQVGTESFIDYSQSNTRISFMKDLSSIEIIPLLHENTLSFFSMPDRDSIACLKREHDRLYALTFSNEIYGWDITTGILTSFKKLTAIDIRKYKHLQNTEENFFSQKCLKKEQIIIISKEPVKDANVEDFLPDFFKAKYGNHVTSVLAQHPRQVHRVKVLEILGEDQVRIVRQFKWPFANFDGVQQTFISDSEKDEFDGKYLWERNEQNNCYLYEWEAEKGESTTGKGEYKFLRTLEKFPVRAIPNTSVRSLQSPDLTRYFDPFEMQIRSMLNDSLIAKIPSNIIEDEGWKKAVQMANKFSWITSDTFQAVSCSGVERAFVIMKGNDEKVEKDEEKATHTVHDYGFTVVPYFDAYELEENHFYDERAPLSFIQTKERLQRKYLQYKRATLLHSFDHYYDKESMDKWKKAAADNAAMFKPKKKDSEAKEGEDVEKKNMQPTSCDFWPIHHDRQIHMSDYLFEVDTGFADLENYTSLIQATMSFTYLDWMMATKIRDNEVDVDDLTNEQVEQLLLNIFPNCKTILHYLTETPDQLCKILKRVAEISKVNSCQLDIPFTMDLEKNTPLHILEKKKDNKNMDLLLSTLRHYGFDHHSRYIQDMWAELISANLPLTVEYLDSRMISTSYTDTITQGLMEVEEELLIEPVSFSTDETLRKLFKYDMKELKDVIEANELLEEKDQKVYNIANVEMVLIDVSDLHNMGSETKQFMEALSATDNFDLFNARPVRNIINYLYEPVKKWTMIYLFYPYLLFLLNYVIYADYLVSSFKLSVIDRNGADVALQAAKLVLDKLKPINSDWTMKETLNAVKVTQNYNSKKEIFSELAEEAESAENVILYGQIPLLLFACYFLGLEIYQIIKGQTLREYFSNVWAYIDFLPPFLTLMIIFQFHVDMDKEVTSTYETVLLGTCSFLMWLKVLYFMRIFKSFSYLIRMIINVVRDMIPFLTVLLFAMIAFADAFYAISTASEEQFITSFVMGIVYIYNMCLGAYENEYGEVAPTFAYILFILCTLFNMIVMFNLLIAIISETFANVNENAEQAGYQERASLIAENLFLVPNSERERYFQDNSYLYQVINSDKTFGDEDEDEVKEKLTEVHRLVSKLEMRLNQRWGPLKIQKPPKKRNLPKSTEDVKLTDKFECKEHGCVLKKAKVNRRWICLMGRSLEDGCASKAPDDVHEAGEWMYCSKCDYSACLKCAAFVSYRDLHQQAAEEDAQVEIVP